MSLLAIENTPFIDPVHFSTGPGLLKPYRNGNIKSADSAACNTLVITRLRTSPGDNNFRSKVWRAASSWAGAMGLLRLQLRRLGGARHYLNLARQCLA